MQDINVFLEKEFKFINKNNVIDNDCGINTDNLEIKELHDTLQENLNRFEKLSFQNYFKIDYSTIKKIMKEITFKEFFYLYKENISISEEEVTLQIQNVNDDIQQKINNYKKNIIVLLKDEKTLISELYKLDENKLNDDLNELYDDLKIKQNIDETDFFDKIKLDNDIDTIQKNIKIIKTSIDDIPSQKNKIQNEIKNNSNNIIQNYKYLNIYNSFPVEEYLEYLIIQQNKYNTTKKNTIKNDLIVNILSLFCIFIVNVICNIFVIYIIHLQ